jgi:hypothetical protein
MQYRLAQRTECPRGRDGDQIRIKVRAANLIERADVAWLDFRQHGAATLGLRLPRKDERGLKLL